MFHSFFCILHTRTAHLILAGRLSRENMLTYTELNFNCSASVVNRRAFNCCLFVYLSVCLCVSVCIFHRCVTESQSHRMVMCFFSLEHFVSLFKAFECVACVSCVESHHNQFKNSTVFRIYKQIYFSSEYSERSRSDE